MLHFFTASWLVETDQLTKTRYKWTSVVLQLLTAENT